MDSSEDAQGDLGRLEVASDSGNNIISRAIAKSLTRYSSLSFSITLTGMVSFPSNLKYLNSISQVVSSSPKEKKYLFVG